MQVVSPFSLSNCVVNSFPVKIRRVNASVIEEFTTVVETMVMSNDDKKHHVTRIMP